MKIKNFEEIILEKLSKKERESNKVASKTAVVVFFILSLLFVISAFLKNSEKNLMIGALFLSVSFFGFVIRRYQAIIRKLLKK